MPHNQRIWTMVADAGSACIYSQKLLGGVLTPVEGARFSNPAVHEPSRNLTSDRLPRSIDSAGSQRHAMEPRVDPHRQTKVVFARQLADYIERQAEENKYDKLILVAPPQLLGDLHAALGKHAEKRLTAEIDKDLTKLPLKELAKHLQPEGLR
ncbi:MAG: host attachment protein [Planctomycetes bacterium]|nr:host attachment protein [Planctomycetota bacterium]